MARSIDLAIRAADPEVAVTIGLHMEDLEEDRRLGPGEAADACDLLSMHGYPIYATWAEGRPTPNCFRSSPDHPLARWWAPT